MTDSKELEKIHQTSVRILAELGFRTDHFEMQERLAGLGCRVSEQRVYIPPDLVERTIKAIPHSFRLYGRNDTTGLSVDADGPFLCTNTGILPNIYDFESETVRRSVRSDVEATTRILDALSEVDIVYVSLLDATEMPAHLITVTDFAATIANTTKPMVGPGIVNGAEARAIISMATALRNGDQRELVARPPCAPFVGSITPLRFPAESVDALIEISRSGLPLMALTNPLPGATAPYTISSGVALGHAEVLACAVMAHAIHPGLPILSFNTPNIADMRTLASTTGGPETGLMRSLAVELARYLGIPSWGHGHTSSTRLDIQASDEKSINMMLIARAQPSLLGGLGGLANVTLTSYETLVIDNERFGALRRISRGVAIDDEHLGYDVIADMVQGKDVISHDHTLLHLRSGEFWKPKLVRRQGLVNGQPDPVTVLERAKAEAKRIMDQHRIEPIPEDIQAEIDAVILEYDAQSSERN
jgi:trimethylamine--corrinoid protein Co-methyltransferase